MAFHRWLEGPANFRSGAAVNAARIGARRGALKAAATKR